MRSSDSVVTDPSIRDSEFPNARPISTARAELGQESTASEAHTWLHRSDQIFVLASLLVTAILLGLHAWKEAVRESRPIEVQHAEISTSAPVTSNISQIARFADVPDLAPRTTDIPSRQPSRLTSSAKASAVLFQIDINSADAQAWTQLPGIGDVLADRIVHDRAERGPFVTIDDLLRVKGIGVKTLAKLRPHLRNTPDSRN